MMEDEYKNFFDDPQETEPPVGLFEKIIFAIEREEQLKKTRKLFFSFLFLLVISLIVTPYSWMILINQVKSSGIIYFLSTAITDLKTIFTFWQDFLLAIVETLPLVEIMFFLISLGICLFTLRLFLYKKGLLIKYLFHRI
jgi:hypothetical protein